MQMINDIIEIKRGQLYQMIGLSGLTSEETMKLSQELERFMNYQSRLKGNHPGLLTGPASVHSNAIHNILNVAAKEKLDLPFEMNSELLDYVEWFKIDLVNTLLHAISDRYGTEVVEYIGEQVPACCIFPEQVQSLEASLKQLDFIFHLNHKSSSYIGEYLPFMDIKNEITLFCHTPNYSSAFNYGIIKGMAKKFNHSLKIKVVEDRLGGQFKIVG
jgi:hypothetical protein